MADNKINTRIQLKNDIEEHWNQAENFIPRQGEVIIYNVDSTHSFPRIKVGDGSSYVNALPFITTPFESLPTGTSASTVAIGNHTHGLGNLTTVALSSKSNLDKHHATAIIRSSSSQLFFGGNGNDNKVDFIGLQLRGSNDEFQLVSETQLTAGNTLLFRQNDNASPNANNWSTWQQLVHTNYINRVGGAGSTTTPVYIAANGTATPINYTIESSVPENAVFTDTTYSAAQDGGLELTGTAFSIATGGVTNNMLAGSIANEKLANSSITIGTSNVSLGGTLNSITGPLTIDSPTFTGTPTSVTPTSNSEGTMIATKAYVDSILAENNAMVFKGTIGTGGTITTLPAEHQAGDTYRVITAGTYAGKYCEIGTLVICIADGTVAENADWTSVETNEDGSIIGPASNTANAIPRFDGTTGRIIKDSNITIDDDNTFIIPNTFIAQRVRFNMGNSPIKAGWRRICKVSGGHHWFLGISGEWLSAKQTGALIAITTVSTTIRPILLSCDVNKQTKIRFINISGSTYWLDIYTNGLSSGSYGNTYLSFYGKVTVSDIQTSTDINEDTGGVEIDLRDIVDKPTFTLQDNDGTNSTTSIFTHADQILKLPSTIKASLTGNATSANTASSLTSITSTDAATSSATWRRLWISYNNNTTGRPAYTDNLAYQTSTNTLKTPHLLIEHASGNQAEMHITYSSTIDYWWGVGTDNVNHGLYDNKASSGAKWILSAGSDNVWTFVGNVTGNVSGSSGSCTGNADTATTASKLSNTSAIGATDRPVYFTAEGVPAQTTYRMVSTNVAANSAIVYNENFDTGIWYVNNIPVASNPANPGNNISDGAMYVNKYSDSWIHEIYGDYRTGQIAVRGKNNGTWQAWRKILDSSNYTDYVVAKTAGVTAVTWDATNKKLTRTINGVAADVMTAAQMSTALELGTIASKAITDYLSVKYSNLDYTSTATSMGVYPINSQIHPVTGKAEFGGAIQFGSISTSNNYYAAQLLISSQSGGTSPVHAYIRRMTSAPGWSNWATLLDNNNYTDYTVTQTGAGASGDWNINAATATSIQTAGTTAQFYRGDNSWSNIIKQTANAALGIDTNLKIGTARKDLNFDITNGSGSGINDGYAGGITWGAGDATYAGIYYQTSSNYGSRLIFGTTNLYANGAYARMIIQNNGNVGIGTLSPDTLLTVNGNAKATKFIGALEGNADTASKISAKLATTTKTYLLGTLTAITTTAANVDITGDTGVYLTTTAGELSATRHSWNVSGTEKAYTVYNTTDDSIDFIFI